MNATATLTLSLAERDAEAIAAMAGALALPVDDFLAKVVVQWIEKPKNYRRLAKRVLADGADARATELRRKRAKTVVKALKRARRVDEVAAATPKAKAKAKKKKKADKPTSTPLTSAIVAPELAATA
jgi:hypothetical protein